MICIQDETPAEDAPEPANSQPHIVVVEHDDYNQYFVAVERQLCMESRDVATALFLLLGTHYILNLSYHPKIADFMRFVQEKIARIQSSRASKPRSPVAATHINGLFSEYASFKKRQAGNDTPDSDSYSS